jgi:hypothetical protein
MKRWMGVPFVALLWSLPATTQGPTAAQKQATVAWVQACQKESGGFAADRGPKTPATLRATTAAVRAIRYFGGELHNKKGCATFVESCYDKVHTGFAPVPGGKADAITTAVGLLAVKDLDVRNEEYRVTSVVYLCAHAKKFEEVRLAAAAYEAIKARCELAADWIAAIERRRNPDGTYGKGGGLARDTAGAVVTVLRLGGAVEKRDNVLKAIQAGQGPDGAWGEDGKGSDLETTYRVVRALVMLKGRPRDVPACRQFIARCRNDDGSYGTRPGQPGSMAGTYFAGIVLHWLEAGN